VLRQLWYYIRYLKDYDPAGLALLLFMVATTVFVVGAWVWMLAVR